MATTHLLGDGFGGLERYCGSGSPTENATTCVDLVDCLSCLAAVGDLAARAKRRLDELAQKPAKLSDSAIDKMLKHYATGDAGWMTAAALRELRDLRAQGVESAVNIRQIVREEIERSTEPPRMFEKLNKLRAAGFFPGETGRDLRMKHGPGGTGQRGDCDPGCMKCQAERAQAQASSRVDEVEQAVLGINQEILRLFAACAATPRRQRATLEKIMKLVDLLGELERHDQEAALARAVIVARATAEIADGFQVDDAGNVIPIPV